MPEYLTKEEAFNKCKREGKILATEKADLERIKANLKIAEEDFEAANSLKKKELWNSAFKLYYDVLHELSESFLQFESIKTENHQCLFAYICEKHPELELSWDFFEKIRTKRNGIHYYGTPIDYSDFKETELQFRLYTAKLKEEIIKRLNSSKP
ncbi:MAG: hypothetical protein V1702_04725 [Candidatus Woesearchaeota archaeon]